MVHGFPESWYSWRHQIGPVADAGFTACAIDVRGYGFGVNVGTDRLRFITPVPVGSRIRGTGEIIGAEEKGGGIQSVVRVSIEVEGEDKPACVIDTISRYYPEAG